MTTNHPRHVPADSLLQEYVKKNNKFEERYSALLSDMEYYIKESGYEGKASVNSLSLGYALVDYFEDIRRLKDYHKIDHINSIKIVSYTAYWLLHQKPIQVTVAEKEIIYINEKFVLAYILEHLSHEDNGHILDRENRGLVSFSKYLLYFLKYRITNVYSLELLLVSFYAGQIYQETKIDLSDKLPQCDFY